MVLAPTISDGGVGFCCFETNIKPIRKTLYDRFMAMLVVHDVDNEPHLVRLDPQNEIGALNGLKVTLAYARVSGQHASIEQVGGVWQITDLDSTNGTYVNGKRIDQPRALTSGDKIYIMDVRMCFFADDQAPPLPVEEGSLRLDFRGSSRRNVPETGRKIPETPMAILVVHDLGGASRAVRLEANSVIGSLPGHKVELTWANVAESHARFEKDGAIWWIADLGSPNGTYVNGERISQSQPLVSGDQICAGSVQMIFYERDRAPPLPVEEGRLVLDFRATFP
jgi:pSer/pThr/pTyr-binding forkhead associated (FHA) protein